MTETGNSTALRERNTALVRSALKAERVATKLRLAQITGLSTVTVGAALDFLTAWGEAEEGDMVPSNGGRPARSYRFCAGYRHVLAAYIRGDTLLLRVADLYGVCVAREEEKLAQGEDQLTSALRRMLERYPTIGAIGIGIPGVEREGIITVSDRPELSGARLAEQYRQEFGLSVALENDVNLAVLGYESREAVGEEESTVYLYFPRGNCPGAGISLGGRLYRGSHRGAGEIKYLPPAQSWEVLDWDDFDAVCDHLAAVVESFTCILDPDRIVLDAPGLSEAHRQAVAWNCEQALDVGFLPKLYLAQDFDGDYERGAILHALNLLETKERRPWQRSF